MSVVDAEMMIRQDDQNERQPGRGGWHHEDVDGYDLADLIAEELAPGLEWCAAST
jgi:hypothetical protein